MNNNRFRSNINYRQEKILEMAEENGWEKTFSRPWRMDFQGYNLKGTVGGTARIIVFPRTMRVLTTLKHPEKGLTTLERQNVDGKLLEKLFKNPRHHVSVKRKQSKYIFKKKDNEQN